MAYLKPQSPIKNGTDYIYPLTTSDQVIRSDGNRLEENGKIVADEAKNAYSSNNPPPYPVTSVNGKTGNVQIDSVPKLDVERKIKLDGPFTGETDFDGSKNVTITVKSKREVFVVAPSDWEGNGPYTKTLTPSFSFDPDPINGDTLLVDLDSTVSDEAYQSGMDAQIRCSQVSSGAVTIKAIGSKPEYTLKIIVTVVG